ncbi:kinase-like protein [Byssothecium circinans]|uniref:Kinase-like protein n=1 Tax=Byssothecium circinans TaxID=147558 RepID=A0A6A5TW82_9PLEO|nr:kinase-like protein [Byssothecium circinans]
MAPDSLPPDSTPVHSTDFSIVHSANRSPAQSSSPSPVNSRSSSFVLLRGSSFAHSANSSFVLLPGPSFAFSANRSPTQSSSPSPVHSRNSLFAHSANPSTAQSSHAALDCSTESRFVSPQDPVHQTSDPRPTPTSNMSTTKAIRIGEEEFPYETKHLLGWGYFGVVNKVQHHDTKRFFACKIVRSKSGDPEPLEREATTLCRLRHRHIAKVVEAFIVGRQLRIIMEPVGDIDLRELLGDTEKIQTYRSSLKKAFGCLANGMAYLHDKEVRHRDIKPDNFILHKGLFIFIDFGTSRDFSNGDGSKSNGRLKYSAGKYCPPEVCEETERNRQSDVFSLGCVFIEILRQLEPRLNLGNITGPYHEHTQVLQEKLRTTVPDDVDLKPAAETTAVSVYSYWR